MVKATENRLRDHVMAVANSMAARPRRQPIERRIGNARSKTRVKTSVIVVRDPLMEYASQVALVQHNQIIQTLTSDRANESLAECVRLRCPHGRLENRQAQAATVA